MCFINAWIWGGTTKKWWFSTVIIVTHATWLAFLSELDPMKLGCATIFDAGQPKAWDSSCIAADCWSVGRGKYAARVCVWVGESGCVPHWSAAGTGPQSEQTDLHFYILNDAFARYICSDWAKSDEKPQFICTPILGENYPIVWAEVGQMIQVGWWEHL